VNGTGLQRVCSACVAVIPQAPLITMALTELGSRLQSMCSGTAKTDPRSPSLDAALKLCTAALGPLEQLLIESQGKRNAAESRARELEARIKKCQDSAAWVAEQLAVLAGGSSARLVQQTGVPALEKSIESCRSLIQPLIDVQAKQASALMRMAVAESSLSEETAARELAEARLRKCDGFFADLGDRLEAAMGTKHSAEGTSQTSGSTLRSGGRLSVPHSLDSASSIRSVGTAWQKNTANCVVCNIEFSKINNKRRRHHCRICGRCVCSACSPSTVELKGHQPLQRACTPCIANAQDAPEMHDEAMHLACRLMALSGITVAPPQLGTLQETLAFCAGAVAPLEALLGGSGSGASEEEATILEARAENVRLARELGGVKAAFSTLRDWGQWAATTSKELQSAAHVERFEQSLDYSDLASEADSTYDAAETPAYGYARGRAPSLESVDSSGGNPFENGGAGGNPFEARPSPRRVLGAVK